MAVDYRSLKILRSFKLCKTVSMCFLITLQRVGTFIVCDIELYTILGVP